MNTNQKLEANLVQSVVIFFLITHYCYSCEQYGIRSRGFFSGFFNIPDSLPSSYERGEILWKTSASAANEGGKILWITFSYIANKGGEILWKTGNEGGKILWKTGNVGGKILWKTGNEGGKILWKTGNGGGKILWKTFSYFGNKGGEILWKTAKEGGRILWKTFSYIAYQLGGILWETNSSASKGGDYHEISINVCDNIIPVESESIDGDKETGAALTTHSHDNTFDNCEEDSESHSSLYGSFIYIDTIYINVYNNCENKS